MLIDQKKLLREHVTVSVFDLIHRTIIYFVRIKNCQSMHSRMVGDIVTVFHSKIRSGGVITIRKISVLALLLVTGCENPQSPAIPLAAALVDKVELVDSCSENNPCNDEMINHAKNDPGKGGISSGRLLRLTEDLEVYRLWDGPENGTNDYGGTNRIGSWWTPDQPSGKLAEYRKNNGICGEWNALRWVTRCVIVKGTLIVTGSTQSTICKQGESFPTNITQQIYVDNTSFRNIKCGKIDETDYPVDPDDLSQKQFKKPESVRGFKEVL